VPRSTNQNPSGTSRRTLLKAATAAATTAAVTGFPTIWAQNIKNVVLRHNGTPVTAIPAIGEQANKDLPFTIKMQASEGNELLNRLLTAPTSVDFAAQCDSSACASGLKRSQAGLETSFFLAPALLGAIANHECKRFRRQGL